MSATNRGAKRRERDAYPTPTWCTEALAKQIIWGGGHVDLLEPCIGDGAISRVLHGKYVDHVEWAEITKGRDFLTYDFGRRFDFVVTNPPFSLAQEFIERSLDLANCVVMLLPGSFMGATCRKEWWKAHKPTADFILSKRPSFTGNGKTDSEIYHWFVWDSTGRQKKGWYWI